MAYGARDEDQQVLTAWSIRTLREQLMDGYSVEQQREIRADVAARLRSLHPQSALHKLAGPVYGVRAGGG